MAYNNSYLIMLFFIQVMRWVYGLRPCFATCMKTTKLSSFLKRAFDRVKKKRKAVGTIAYNDFAIKEVLNQMLVLVRSHSIFLKKKNPSTMNKALL